MRAKAPEVTVEIVRVRKNKRTNQYELVIGRVVSYKKQETATLGGVAKYRIGFWKVNAKKVIKKIQDTGRM